MKKLVLSFALALAVGSAPGAATAQSHVEAGSTAAQREGREHFTRGLDLYREGNFSGARAEFQRAYDVAPSFRILFNLGQSALELQDYAGAHSAFERYLSEGGARVPDARRAEVDKELHDLELRIGRLTVSTNPPGAEIAVDGVRVGTTPLAAPIVVSVGRRTVTATLDGRVPASRAIDVAGGDQTNVALDLALPEIVVPVPVVAPVVPIVEPPKPEVVLVPPPPAATSRYGTAVAVGVATTGALVVTSAIFGGLAITANSTLNTRLNEFPGSASGIANARSNVHTYALVSDIAGGIAIAAAAATIYIAVRHRPTSAASVGIGPGSARFELSF